MFILNSKRIAALIGPTIVAMVASEFPLVQPHLYGAQIPPVVYLSGVLMFVDGLAIVRAPGRLVRRAAKQAAGADAARRSRITFVNTTARRRSLAAFR